VEDDGLLHAGQLGRDFVQFSGKIGVQKVLFSLL
jgi:hypothetical protein